MRTDENKNSTSPMVQTRGEKVMMPDKNILRLLSGHPIPARQGNLCSVPGRCRGLLMSDLRFSKEDLDKLFGRKPSIMNLELVCIVCGRRVHHNGEVIEVDGVPKWKHRGCKQK